MNRFKQFDKTKIWVGILIVSSILSVVIGISIQQGYLVLTGLFVFVIVLEFATPASVRKTVRKRVSNRVRYRIHHCDLEVLMYSSKYHYFHELQHPMDELLSIDYKASYKRHYIRASLNEEAFVYHEEFLFPTRKTPAENMFQGFVVEFEVKKRLPKKFTINEPLLVLQFPKNFLYTNGKMMRVYIPNRSFITNIGEQDNIEEKIKELSDTLQEIIQFKTEYMSLYKEE